MVVPQIRWLDQIGGTEEEQTEGITVSSGQERLFATGFTFGTFGDNSNTPGSGFDVWVASYDLGGDLQDSVQLNSEAEGAVPDDFARALTFDPSAGSSGLLYVVGETFGDITNNSDRAINTGSSDGFVSVYQPTENGLGGSPIASFQFDIGDNGRRDFVSDVALDSDGNVYVVGRTQQGNNGFDAYVAKFTPETLRNFDTTTPGEEQAEWIELFSTSGRDEAEAVGISDGELFVTGSTTGNIDADGEETNDSNIWLARISDLESGNDSSITKNELESPGEDEAFDLAFSGGDVYLTGSTRGFLDSQDDPVNDPDENLGRRDAWVAKFDGETFSETATPNWIEQFGSSTDDFARGITAFSTVNEDQVEETTISVTGYTDGNLNRASNQGSLDAWVVELIDDRAEEAVSLPNEAPTLSQAPIFGEGGIVLDPIISGALSNGEVVGNISAIDRQGDDITFELLSGAGNLDINSETGELTLANPEVASSLEFEVQARDDAQPRNSNQVEVILPVDQNAPPIISDSTFNNVPVTDGPLGGVVANFADPDNSNNFSFRIVEGNIDINNAPLVSDQTLILDEFNDNSAIGTVNATDPEGESLTFTIASGSQGEVFSETTLNNDETEITFETEEDDGKAVTFAIDQDTGELTLSNITNAVSVGELAALNNNFQLTIQADDGSETNTGDIEIAIVDNPPEFSQEQGFSFDVIDVAVADNGDTVGTVTASDPGGETVTYEITGGDDTNAFTIDPNSGEITINDVNELTESFSLFVEANDSANTSETEVVIPVEISQAFNNAPVITDSTFNVDFTAGGDVPEEIGTLNFGNPENDALSFTITSGDATGALTIQNDGTLRVENESLIEAGDTFNLVVQVDDGNATDTSEVQVNFADKAPEFTQSGFSFAIAEPELVESGDILGTVTANDPESSAVSYRIVEGNEGNALTIDSDSGELIIINDDPSALSGGTELIVEARDENGNTSQVPVLISVDEDTFSINNEGQISLSSTENVASGDEVNLTVEVDDGVDTDEGELTLNFDSSNPNAPVFERQGGFAFNTLLPETASDGDVAGTVETESNGDTFAIVGGNDPDGDGTNAFEIDPDSGEISLVNADQLTENYELTVEADNGNQTTQTAVIIPVNTANDAPVISETDLVSENVATNSIAGIVEAVDPDGDDLDFTLAGADDQLAIDEDGVITITSEADFILGDSIDFEVMATDEVGAEDTAQLSLNFRDLVELDPEAGTQIIGSSEADFSRDITSDRGGNIFIGGETAGVLSSAEPPIIRDGFVVGDTVTLLYSKPLDTSAPPARSDFNVLVNTVINNAVVGSPEIGVTNVEIDGQSVILSLTQGVTQDDLVGVSYTDPSDFDDENAIQDRFGNDAGDINVQVPNLTGTGEDIPELPEEENEEENAGALDVWLSRLGDNDPSPAAGTTENTEPPQPTQSVFTNIDEVAAQTPTFQNTSFNFDVNYSAIDAEGNPAPDLSGLGLRMHFDSSVLTLENLDLNPDATANTPPINLPNDIQADTNNFDGDGATDSFVLLSWSDVNGEWPQTGLGTRLFTASLTTARDFAGDVDSAINFTSSSTADGFSFASSDPVIAPEKYTYDVDDNGEVDALTDGLQILNFLFDNNRSALDGAIASNANRDAEEIIDYLNLAANSSAFNVDGNLDTPETPAEDALTDGILIVRYMFGFRGEALINGAIADNAERTTAPEIEGYIQDFLPV